jgi:hypothetical protein
MEILLSIADFVGVKWVRDEKDPIKKTIKGLLFVVLGIVTLIGAFTAFYG